MLEVAQREGPFPHGFILHSWAGNTEQVKAFSKIKGVHFSISGHTMSLPSRKAVPMLQQVRSCLTLFGDLMIQQVRSFLILIGN